MENTIKNFAIIGVGNCGGQVASLAEKKYPMLFDSIYINTSRSDLAMINSDTGLKLKIGVTDEVEGSGKNRSKMKVYLRDSIEMLLSNANLLDRLKHKKYVFVIASAAGGTGSGAGPVLLEVLRNYFKDIHFILVAVLPKEKALLTDQGNSLEFLDELYGGLGKNTTYMIYDNDRTAEMNPTEALVKVNENIVEDLRVLTGVDNYPTPYESIDAGDMETIITTPGRLLVATVKDGLNEKNMEDTRFDDLFIKAVKDSCHAETDRNKKVVRRGIITYFTQNVNKLFTLNMDKLDEFIGIPSEPFNHNAISESNENMNFMHLIAAGLSPINDRAKKMKDRVTELTQNSPDDSSDYALSGDNVTESALSLRAKESKSTDDKGNVNVKDLFSGFMK